MNKDAHPADLTALSEELKGDIARIEGRLAKRVDNLASDVGKLADACSRFEKHVHKQYGENLEDLATLITRMQNLERTVFGRALNDGGPEPANSDEPKTR